MLQAWTVHRLFNLVISQILMLGLFVSAVAVCISAGAQQSTIGSNQDLNRAIQLYHQGNSKAAIGLLTAVVKKDKEDAEAWYYLGLARTRDHDLRNARKAFEVATKLRPDFGSGHTGYSYTLMLTNRTAEAGREAIELNSRDPEAHYVLGVVRLREGKKPGSRTRSSGRNRT